MADFKCDQGDTMCSTVMLPEGVIIKCTNLDDALHVKLLSVELVTRFAL